MSDNSLTNLINNIQNINDTANTISNKPDYTDYQSSNLEKKIQSDTSDTLNNSTTTSNEDNIQDDLRNLLSSIISNTKANSNENKSYTESDQNTSDLNIDFDTIMKITNIIKLINESNNNPRTNLLLALKPFLKEYRQNKIDQYITFAKIIDIYKTLGGDINAKL